MQWLSERQSAQQAVHLLLNVLINPQVRQHNRFLTHKILIIRTQLNWALTMPDILILDGFQRRGCERMLIDSGLELWGIADFSSTHSQGSYPSLYRFTISLLTCRISKRCICWSSSLCSKVLILIRVFTWSWRQTTLLVRLAGKYISLLWFTSHTVTNMKHYCPRQMHHLCNKFYVTN